MTLMGFQATTAIFVLLTLLPAPAAAQDPCQRRPLDPRTARLQALDVQVTREAIAGRVKNTSNETALGVAIWVNYYLSRRGGLSSQQCIPVGDLRPGEERGFLGTPVAGAERAEGYTYSVDAAGWR
jgi:hypothetical protein